MTTYYGALVGTPKNNVPPSAIPSTYENGRNQVLVRDRYEAAGIAAGSLIEIARNLPWETVIDPYLSDFSFDDMGAAQTLSIGDATFPTALCNAQDTGTAAGTAKVMRSVDIANYFKPLWQVLGHASLAAAKLVAPACTLIGTTATNAATGTLVWQIHGVRRMS